ncbi:putative uncharacterized protein [Bacteroides ovatus CAG:22]|nr:putative uncharacterized protein [Bacteroides ovatus CAG:22]
MLRHTTHRHDIRQVDFCTCRRGKLNLSFFSSFFQTLQSHRILSQVSTFVVLEFLYQPIDDYLVEVITTQVSVTICRKYFKHTTTKFEDRDIECTTTKVEYSNLHIFVSLIQTVSKSCGCRFVYNTFYFQTSNLSGFLSSLTLRVGKICRNGDNCFCYFLTEIVFGSFLHFLKNHCRNFLRSVQTSVDVNTRSVIITFHYFIRNTSYLLLYLIPSFTHETFDREDCTCRVRNSLTFCRITHLTFTAIYESDNRRSRTFTFTVCNYYRFVTFEYGNTRVCSS